MLTLAIESVKQAYKEFKSFCIDDFEGDYRFAAKQALKDILERRMNNTVDAYLEDLRVRDISDRRNGYYPRHLLTELGDTELQLPRTRTSSGPADKPSMRVDWSFKSLILLQAR